MATQVERRNATRRAVMVATRRVAQRDGADGLTTATIAAEAGVSRGTLYHHFGSTEGIVTALYESVPRSWVGRSVARSRTATR